MTQYRGLIVIVNFENRQKNYIETYIIIYDKLLLKYKYVAIFFWPTLDNYWLNGEYVCGWLWGGQDN